MPARAVKTFTSQRVNGKHKSNHGTQYLRISAHFVLQKMLCVLGKPKTTQCSRKTTATHTTATATSLTTWLHRKQGKCQKRR